MKYIHIHGAIQAFWKRLPASKSRSLFEYSKNKSLQNGTEKKRMIIISTPKVLNSINNTVDKLSRASEFLHSLLRMTIQHRQAKLCFN